MSLSKYFHTLKYLKKRQIFFQLIQPFKNLFNKYYSFNKYSQLSIHFINPRFIPKVRQAKTNRVNEFVYLNLTKKFDQEVQWNFEKFGKLWNYQLQYMEFLIDERLEVFERTELLIQISTNIKNKELKLEPFPVSLRLIYSILFVCKHRIQEKRINDSLKMQIHFLETNLEYHIDANHLLINAIALRLSSLVLKDKKLDEKSRSLLHSLLKEQILIDGAHFERSPMYHKLILELLCCLLHCFEKFEMEFTDLESVVQKMSIWLYTMTDGNKQTPLLQDSAGDYLFGAKELFEIANISDFELTNFQLKDSCYRLLRNKNLFLLFNGGNASPTYQPGHYHADALSFVLYVNQVPIIVDTGTSTYETLPERLNEKSTYSHNTVTLNNMNQAQVWSRFRVAKRASVSIAFSDNDSVHGNVLFEDRETRHERKIEASDELLIINDYIHALSKFNPKAYFHCDYKAKVALDNSTMNCFINNCKVCFEKFVNVEIEDYKQAIDFNKTENAKRIVVEFNRELITRIYV